MIVFRILYLFN